MRTGACLVAALAVLASGCDRGDHASPPAPSAGPAGAGGSFVLAPHDGVRWMTPQEAHDDVARAVREAAAREKADGRVLLVYVGATWCEPCQRFHHAVDHGDLDAAFPRLSVLAFDLDRDSEALATAGYVSRLIPLFALPAADGRGSGRQIEGSVKGTAAVDEITPRLRGLLAGGT